MVIDGIVDSSVIIDYLRGLPAAHDWFLSVAGSTMAIPPVVWMEVVQGASNKVKQKRIIRFLSQFHIEHPLADDNLWAMEQVSQFSLSHGIGFADIMTASVAVRLGVPVYTTNIKHFTPLPEVDARRPY